MVCTCTNACIHVCMRVCKNYTCVDILSEKHFGQLNASTHLEKIIANLLSSKYNTCSIEILGSVQTQYVLLEGGLLINIILK